MGTGNGSRLPRLLYGVHKLHPFKTLISHIARITKYQKRYPEVRRWQHVYPIDPKHGRGHRALTNRDDYIVLDCVKDNFDDEQPFI